MNFCNWGIGSLRIYIRSSKFELGESILGVLEGQGEQQGWPARRKDRYHNPYYISPWGEMF